MPQAEISVVIIGRNEGKRLVQCIESVFAISESFGPLELIYVDSCSTDDSPAQAAKLGAKVIELKTGKMCAARARNAGWQVTSAPIILFLDGDTVLEPSFMMKAMPEFDNPDIMIVYGSRREMHTEKSVYNRIMDLDWIDAPGFKDSCGGDALFRRTCLETTGGFNPDLIAGEEPELCRRIQAQGGLIIRIDALMTRHDLGISTLQQYWKRAMRTGYAYAEVSSIYKNAAYPFWLAESRKNVLNGSLYLVGLLVSIALSLVFHSWVVLALFGLGVGLRIVRSAYKFRRKSGSLSVLVLYGLHSHMQQVPILLGQLKFWMSSGRKWRSDLVGYKA